MNKSVVSIAILICYIFMLISTKMFQTKHFGMGMFAAVISVYSLFIVIGEFK